MTVDIQARGSAAVQHRPHVDRALRVNAPVSIAFQSGPWTVREYAKDISESGVFLPTDKLCEVGSEGTLTIQGSHFEKALEIDATVVRAVRPGEETDRQPVGLGIRFKTVTPELLDRLRALVEGVRSGTVVEAIRRSLREAGGAMATELRKRPADQKMMLALSAHGEEINALIRDGHPSVQQRLLECPRVTATHVRQILRNPNLPTSVISAIKRHAKFVSNPEVRFLIVTHQNTMLPEAMEQLRFLPPDRQRRIGGMPQLRTQLRARAGELTRKPSGPGRRR